MQDRIIDLFRWWAFSKERNSVKRIKASIFLETRLAKDTMQEFESNLEEKFADF